MLFATRYQREREKVIFHLGKNTKKEKSDDKEQTIKKKKKKKMDHLRAEKLKSYNQTFQSLDPENKGFLKPKMVRQALKHIGFNPTETELEERLVAIDQNENNKIEFEEFLELTNQLESKIKFKKEGTYTPQLPQPASSLTVFCLTVLTVFILPL